jgi:hypothetical protein
MSSRWSGCGIASVARRAAELVRAFVEAARALAAAVGRPSGSGHSKLRSLMGLRIVGASVMAARSPPAAARTREALAAARLARPGRRLPQMICERSSARANSSTQKTFGVLTWRGRRGFEEFASAVKAFVADSNTVHVAGTSRCRGAHPLQHDEPLSGGATAGRRVHIRLANDDQTVGSRRTRWDARWTMTVGVHRS